MSEGSIGELLDDFYKERNFKIAIDFFLENERARKALIDISLQSIHEKHCSIGSWICAHLAEKDCTVFDGIHGEIIHFLQTEKLQSALRNWMKVMTFLPIHENHEGEMIDLCVGFIEDSNNKVALQMYAMTNLIPLMKKYPEILPEILAFLDLHAEGKSPAYHAIHRKFKKATKNIIH